jgi:hypothetical protein
MIMPTTPTPRNSKITHVVATGDRVRYRADAKIMTERWRGVVFTVRSVAGGMALIEDDEGHRLGAPVRALEPVPAPRLAGVNVGRDDDGHWHVTPIWSGVDLPDNFGWQLGPNDQRLAERLRNAIRAGVVFDNPHVTTTNDGSKTYVTWDRCNVMGRRLNADLRRLGF